MKEQDEVNRKERQREKEEEKERNVCVRRTASDKTLDPSTAMSEWARRLRGVLMHPTTSTGSRHNHQEVLAWGRACTYEPSGPPLTRSP